MEKFMEIWGVIAVVVFVTWALFMIGKLFYLEIQKEPNFIWNSNCLFLVKKR